MEAVTPSVGWGVLHLFYRIDHDRPGGTEPGGAKRILDAVEALEADGHQALVSCVLGHKADLGVMALGPDLARLQAFQAELAGAPLVPVWSYVSLTELSEYSANVPDAQKQARLYPKLPPDGMNAFCFYPMSKRREPEQNWYALPYEDRLELMYEHGKSGRTFAGRIVQLVTGSTGLDDYEWGVTLFGVHPDDIKACVYTMRFDRASTHYAEFGPFVTGMVASLDEVLRRVGIG
jgi:chlorite dismutase